MKRALMIFFLGILAGVLGYFGIYYSCTVGQSAVGRDAVPELAWLKHEFHLSEAEFSRISQLHEEYLTGCSDRCTRIDLQNQELTRLLAASDRVTPEISKLISQSALLRAECHQVMLQHFYDVSRTMPPEQGRRYLDWVQRQTILADTHSTMRH